MPPLPHKTSPPTPQVVEEVFTREGQLFELVVAGRVLRTTPEHPFFVEGQGWTPAGELQPGHLLSTATGDWLPVESITNAHQSLTVYNFRVSNYHTYFIAPRDAAFDVWVHNTYLSQQIRNGNIGIDAVTGKVLGMDPLTNSSTLLSRGRNGAHASLEHVFPREALKQAITAAGGATAGQHRLLKVIVDGNFSNIAVSKSFNSAKGARTAFEFAQTPTGRQLVQNNPQYLVGLARQQRTAARAINEVLGGNFAPQKYIDHAARLEELLGIRV